VKIGKSRFQWFLPLPFVGWFSRNKVEQIAFPASRVIGFADVFLRVIARTLPLVGLIGALAYAKFADDSSFVLPIAAAIFIGSVAGGWLAILMRAFVLRRVRVTAFGGSSCELRFRNESYGEAFAELNGFPLGVERTS
jgi:hypothetical protein